MACYAKRLAVDNQQWRKGKRVKNEDIVSAANSLHRTTSDCSMLDLIPSTGPFGNSGDSSHLTNYGDSIKLMPHHMALMPASMPASIPSLALDLMQPPFDPANNFYHSSPGAELHSLPILSAYPNSTNSAYIPLPQPLSVCPILSPQVAAHQQPPATQQLREVQLAQRVPQIIDATRKGRRRRKPYAKKSWANPFMDCLGTFGIGFRLRSFPWPTDGRVNGYVKFNCPQNPRTKKTQELSGSESARSSGFVRTAAQSRSNDQLSNGRQVSASQALGRNTRTPHFIPPQFGFMAIMDEMDRKLFKFYLDNWCPGRSILRGTNVWYTDFAKMHESPGILAAIQSLAGIYVHDYIPEKVVQKRVNEKFATAESRFCQLFQQPVMLYKDTIEFVTLAILLSMQDIVLTERRLKKPRTPRWLIGFLIAEQLLRDTDPGHRFYNDSNVQINHLWSSQTVIVGSAIILAECIMPLPLPKKFNSIQQEKRFGFLLHGSESDWFKIHGCCGFSRRLLHLFSQVTFCAACIMQEPETPIFPKTAQSLYRSACDLRQWSEYWDWGKVQEADQPIQWIRQVGESYMVENPDKMTEVTAEAWRITGLIYSQCRLSRVPRNYPDVVANLQDLAKCISIMPTSGNLFTAQAPLLPVFLLGLLATNEDHEVASEWFKHVSHTPVRSSVPPLYGALERVRNQMVTEIPLHSSDIELDPEIANRFPWFEKMILIIERGDEVLCLIT